MTAREREARGRNSGRDLGRHRLPRPAPGPIEHQPHALDLGLQLFGQLGHAPGGHNSSLAEIGHDQQAIDIALSFAG